MNEPKLSQRDLVLIRRAAEDAIHACNRHYGPFVDVVAHPLNICALVDMAQMSIGQQAKVNELQALYTQQGINMLKLHKRMDAALALIKNFKGNHFDADCMCELVSDIEQALNDGESK